MASLKKNVKYTNCVIIAGNPGCGKSTCLNNIFNLKLKTGISAYGVTKCVQREDVIKSIDKEEVVKYTSVKETRLKTEVELIVIDTPGIGDKDINKDEVARDIVDNLGERDYVLIYCLSIGPGKRVTQDDHNTVNVLHRALGRQAWKRCVILFTYSDTLRKNNFSPEMTPQYKAYVQETAEAFQRVLAEQGDDMPNVKTIFQCTTGGIFDQTENEKEIVAIPIGKKSQVNFDILPGIVAQNEDWTHVVFFQIMRKATQKSRFGFLILKYGATILGATASAAIGAGVGAGFGAIGGAAGGPLGIAAGAAVGAIVGGSIVTAGLTISAVKSIMLWLKNH